MNAKKITLCAVLVLSVFIGMNIGDAIPKASAATCYCQGSCDTACISDPVHGYSKCLQVFSRAVGNDVSGIGLSNTTNCGQLKIGTNCTTVAGICGANSYTNGDCTP